MKPDHRIVIIEALPSGVSGDKYLGALLDLGGELDILRKVATTVSKNLPGSGSVKVDVRKVERGEIGAQLVTIESSERTDKRKGVDVLHTAETCVEKLGLSEWGSRFSISTVKTLLDAESKVHSHSTKEVELHELGSADTLVDVLGVASLADALGLDDAVWWSTPIAVGTGTTRFSNRTYPNPPPAVAEILRNNHFPMDRGLIDAELSTPTGAAITVNLVSKFSETHPVLRPERIGYGAGSKDLDGVSNALRLTIGQIVGPSHSHDEMVILETNLDDVSGEVLGRASERLLESGARDVTITPVYMKKNRPGHIVSIIAKRDDVERLAEVMMMETGTLGIRELPIARHISSRKNTEITVKIKGKSYRVRVKLSQDKTGKVIRGKPEYEDVKKISDETGLSILEIQNLISPKIASIEE